MVLKEVTQQSKTMILWGYANGTRTDKFRSKYPEYGDLDDSSLAGMLSKKYPDAYGDLPGKVIQPITGIGPPWWVGPGRTAATTIGMIGGGLAGGGLDYLQDQQHL